MEGNIAGQKTLSNGLNMSKPTIKLFQYHWSIPLGLAVVLFGCSIWLIYYGWTIKADGGSFSRYWMLALVSLWGSANFLQKLTKNTSDDA